MIERRRETYGSSRPRDASSQIPRKQAPSSDAYLSTRRLFLLETAAQPPAVEGPQRGDHGRGQRLRASTHADAIEQLLELREAGVGDAIDGHVADVLGLVLAFLVDLAEQHLAAGPDQRVFAPAAQHH